MNISHPENPQHVENLKTLELLLEQGFQGPDASLSESLFEYGFAWRDLGDELLVIYRHPSIEGSFDRCVIKKDYDVQKEHDWVQWKHIADYCGAGSIEEWLELPLLRKLQDLVSYHGTEEIFGTSYWEGFKIKE